jgi:N-dimethylarginine dimethylaminohydrolase
METLFNLDYPAILMNFPFTVSNLIKNNELMLGTAPFNKAIAYRQFLNLYKSLSQHSLIYILPSEKEFQDLPYVSNSAICLKHLKNVALISNFTSLPRIGEEILVQKFLKSLGFRTFKSPFKFEGAADLKWVRNNTYIGGYGIRTEKSTFYWMRNHFDMEIVDVELTDPKLFHLDCSFLPLKPDLAMVVTSAFSRKDLHRIEAIVDIIDVPIKHAYNGWTNAIKIENIIFQDDLIGDQRFEFQTIMNSLDFDVKFIDIKEFEKSGAGASCFILGLN